MNRIAEEIVIRRGIAGLTQKGLAEKLNTTQRTVAAWESGVSIPRRAMQARIAAVLGLPEDYFFSMAEPDIVIDPETKRLEEKDAELIQALEKTSLSQEEKKSCLESCRRTLWGQKRGTTLK